MGTGNAWGHPWVPVRGFGGRAHEMEELEMGPSPLQPSKLWAFSCSLDAHLLSPTIFGWVFFFKYTCPSSSSTSPPLHSTPLRSTPLHSTPFHSTPLHSTLLHSTSLHSSPLHSSSLHFTSLHFTSLHFTSLHFASLHFTSLHLTSLHSSHSSEAKGVDVTRVIPPQKLPMTP